MRSLAAPPARRATQRFTLFYRASADGGEGRREGDLVEVLEVILAIIIAAVAVWLKGPDASQTVPPAALPFPLLVGIILLFRIRRMP